LGNDQKQFKKDLDKYFFDVQFLMKIYDKTKKETDLTLASNFNVFNYINPNENGLSNIFADLLNPNGNHGQREAFLKEFLNIIKQNKKVALMNCKIVREDVTHCISNNLRRIDITLYFENGFVVGIENKPWSTEQDNQLQDYQEHLNKKYGVNWCLVYVSGDGSEPISIKENLKEQYIETGKLVVLNYEEDVAQWLNNCYKECKAEKVRVFIKDFIAYIEENFENVSEDTDGGVRYE